MKEGDLTKLVKVRVDPGRAGDGADQSGLEEGGPAVDETPLPSDVVLQKKDMKKKKDNG